MLRTFIWYAHFAFSLILKVPDIWKLRRLEKKLPREEFDELTDDIAARWACSHIKCSGAEIIVNGLENIPKDETVVFVSNHQSNFDIAVFLGLIRKPKGYTAKMEVLKIPVVRTYMRFLKCVFMDRDDLKNSAKAIFEAVEILKGGHSMVIFPEGTRNKDGKVGEFKAGSFKLATKSKCPIIPVTMNGTYKIMEANKNWIKPEKAYVTIHEKIDTANLTKEELTELPDRVRKIIVSAMK